MKNLALKALLLSLWLPPAATQAMVTWEPIGSGRGYFGGNGSAQGGDIVGDVTGFDILKLEMTQTGTELNVSILTNFSEGELLNDTDVSKIVFGDLIITAGTDPWHPDPTGDPVNFSYDTASSTNPGHTQWSFVVRTPHPGALTPGDVVTGAGAIYSVTNADLLNSNDAAALQDGVRRDNQYIALADGQGTDTGKTAEVTISSVPVQNPNPASDPDFPGDPVGYPGSCDSNPDNCNYVIGTLLNYKISLADIDLPGLDFANMEVAVRWTMTCANDIVEGSLQLADVVPEPATPALLLVGAAALARSSRLRKRASANPENPAPENKAEPTGDGGMFSEPLRSHRHRAGFRRKPARCNEVA